MKEKIEARILELRRWATIHKEANEDGLRDIELAACEVQIEELQRCLSKLKKPQLIRNWIQNADMRRINARIQGARNHDAEIRHQFHVESFHESQRIKALICAVEPIAMTTPTTTEAPESA